MTPMRRAGTNVFTSERSMNSRYSSPGISSKLNGSLKYPSRTLPTVGN